MMKRDFGGVIWTNHALDRLRERGIKQGDAWATFRRPESSKYGNKKGVFVYYKTYGNEKIEVVAKKNERGQWVILSVWSKKVFEKEKNYLKKKKNKSIFKSVVKRIFDI